MKFKSNVLISALGIAASLMISTTTLFAAAPASELADLYIVNGDGVEAKYNKFLEEKIKSIGFVLTDPHKRVNDGYAKKYGSTKLDLLSFMSVSNKESMSPLLEIEPKLAGFNPFNMLIYKALDEKEAHVGHIRPEAVLDILDIKDEKVRSGYIKAIEPLDKMLKEEFGGEVKTLKLDAYSDTRMMEFEVPFERGDDLDEFIDDFQERFEAAFEEKKYIIAGFFNFKESFDGVDRLPSYDAFWVYSLCHFKFSYSVFDGEGKRPESGLFAPCSMYMYIKKDDNKLMVGMPRLDNWAKAISIKDPKRLELIAQLDKEIPEIMVSLGAKVLNGSSKNAASTKAPESTPAAEETKPAAEEPKNEGEPAAAEPNDGDVIIEMPKVPAPVKPVKVSVIGGNPPVEENHSHYKPRAIVNKPSQPPVSASNSTSAANDKDAKAGDVVSSRVSSYLRGKLQSIEEIKKALEGAGFTILATNALDKDGELVSIVFSDAVLTKMADKTNRGFAGSLRVLVNKKDNEIAFINPLYMARAFMQDEFDQKTVAPVLEKLRNAFPGLSNSDDMLKFNLLPKYRFMSGMPFYEDMIVVGKGKNEELLAKVSKSADVVFTQTLSADRTLIGINLSKRTAKFIKKIGVRNAALLPYPIIIENGEAKILDPKYYIALMYPDLKMSQFMTISTVPGAIQVDCESIFR